MQILLFLSAFLAFASAMQLLPEAKRFAPAATTSPAPTAPATHELFAQPACGNNCARAVAGTRNKVPSYASRSSDCASFLRATVFTYNHLNITASSVTPTAVPTYASDCSTPGSPQSAYSSACGCFNLTASTVTTTATYNPTCTSAASNKNCGANLPGFGFVPSNLVLKQCANAVSDDVPGCSCQLDVENKAFCDSGFAGYQGKRCSKNIDCEADERCAYNPCYGSSCERTAPGSQCDDRNAKIIFTGPGARNVTGGRGGGASPSSASI
jgi:hypothetical protein